MTVSKQQLIEHLSEKLNAKIEALNTIIASAIESRDNESKSSVGDKYETSRSMMQIEITKNQQQLSILLEQKVSLNKIDLDKKYQQAGHGAIISAENAIYFISIGFGKVKFGVDTVFVISPVSPIGKLLLGKQAGDTFVFQGKTTRISKVG